MQKLLRDKMLVYKNMTVEMLDSLQKDNLDKLNNILDERQKLIEDIKHIDYSKEDMQKAISEFQIMKLQQQLDKLALDKKNFITDKIKEIAIRKKANNEYNKPFYANTRFFNKKI